MRCKLQDQKGWDLASADEWIKRHGGSWTMAPGNAVCGDPHTHVKVMLPNGKSGVGHNVASALASLIGPRPKGQP